MSKIFFTIIFLALGLALAYATSLNKMITSVNDLTLPAAAKKSLGLASAYWWVILILGGLYLNSLHKKAKQTKVAPTPEDERMFAEDAQPSAPMDYDVVIIGAGVVGASLGTILARAGKRVCIVEQKLSEPDRIVGELLQPGGVQKLQEMGLSEALEGFDAQTTTGYGIYQPYTDVSKMMKIEYPYATPDGKAVTGRGFHNGRLLMRLRAIASKTPGVTLIEGTAKQLLRRSRKDGSRVVGFVYQEQKSDKPQVVRGHLTVACDGNLSGFRKALCEGNFATPGSFLGLVLKNPNAPLPAKGHVILAEPSPILLYPISSTEWRMLIDFPREMGIPSTKNDELKKYLKERVTPQLPPQVQSSFLAAVETTPSPQSQPNRNLAARPFTIPGVLLVGDSLNMRHPLTGGGMTVGFTDVCLLQKLLTPVDFSDKSELDETIKQFYSRRGKQVKVINILADALYGVFVSEGVPELRKACYDYLFKGGVWSDGPIRFLSGVSKSQSFLIFHFFAVALFGCGRLCLRLRFWTAYNILRTAVRIITPLLYQENPHLPMYLLCQTLKWAFWLDITVGSKAGKLKHKAN